MSAGRARGVQRRRCVALAAAMLGLGVTGAVGTGVESAGATIATSSSHASAAADAGAATLVRGISDGRVFGSGDPAVRAAGIRVAKAAGAAYARLPIAWSLVARNETFIRPDESRVPLSDPAHPVYEWRRIDAALRDLRAAGLTPMIYFLAAPPWAMSAPRYVYAAPGTWAPRPADLAALASAVARRYDGSYADPLDGERPLPRVAHFQPWNEPNLARYLQPQWVGEGGRPSLFSARWYRRMHLAAYAAIHARQPDAVVALAGLAPTGDADDGSARVSPLRFLRALLCLDGEAQRCGAPLPFDAVAIHPLSTGDPDRPATHADDLAIADLRPKLDDLFRRARRAGRLAATADPPLWVTELNWVSAGAGGVTAAQQEAVVGRAMLRLHQARAAIVNWQFATDPPPSRTAGSLRPAGLTVPVSGDHRDLPGAPKRFLDGFAQPVAVIALGPDQAFVWALAAENPARAPARAPASERTATTATTAAATTTVRAMPNPAAMVQRRFGTRWRRIATVPLSASGVASGVVRVPRGSTVRLLIAGVATPAVRVHLRLGRIRSNDDGLAPADGLAALGTEVDGAPGGTAVARAARAVIEVREQADHRAPDADGPGAFLPLRPVIPGGTPPSMQTGPVLPVPVAPRPSRRLRFRGTPGDDVLIGTSMADHLVGLVGDDLLIGLGGDDRFDAGTGRDVVVRSRVVVRR